MENKKRILCIDDDEVFQFMMKNLLEKDYIFETAKSGKQAINHLVQCEDFPDLILLDIIMPEMDGWETINNIRGITILNNIPIIFITSLDASIKEQAIARGGTDFMTKPIDTEELLKKIKNILH